MKFMPLTGSPPMPTQVRLAEPDVAWSGTRLRRSACPSATRCRRARLVDVARHDADLAFARRDDAGAVRADQHGVRCLCSTLLTRTMSSTGMPSVMQTMSSMPASAASRIASAANGAGT